MTPRIVPAILLVLAACTTHKAVPAPPRVDNAPPVASKPSLVAVPIAADIVMLERALNARVPRVLWQIDEQQKACIPAQRILKIRVTPDIGCRVVGQAVRGPITVGGAGETLTLSMPVKVQVAARDVGKILKGETATAGARVRAIARLDMSPDWRPRATVDIDYRWTQVPGIDFAGQRIKFGRQVDPRLQPIIAQLEREIPRELAALDARREAAAMWSKGFTVISLNAKKPPVWLRVTPQRVGFGGYRIEGKTIRLLLSATALTETFVGIRPEPAPVTPLPALAKAPARTGGELFVPVVAAYGELEPVLMRALQKLSARGVAVPNIGQVAVRFTGVTIYATEGERIAVGLDLEAEGPNGVLKPRGRVWLTGKPVNAPGSRVVRIAELRITGETDSPATNLLAAVALSPATQAAIGDSLSENFERDFQELLTKTNAALKGRREGAFFMTARLTDVVNGPIGVYGKGLYMPVEARGAATLRYAPPPG